MTKTFTQDELDIAVRTERHRHARVFASAQYRGREGAAHNLLASSDLDSAAIIAALSGMAAGQAQHSSSDAEGEPLNDFRRGEQIASSLPSGLRK